MALLLVDRKTDRVIQELDENNGLLELNYSRKLDKNEMALSVEALYEKSEYFIPAETLLIIKDETGIYREFVVDDVVEINGETIEVYTSPSHVSGIKEGGFIGAEANLHELAGAQILHRLLEDTKWGVGRVDARGNFAGSLGNDEEKDALVLLEEHVEHDGLVLDFQVTVDMNEVIHRLVNMREPDRRYNGKEIERGKDLVSLTRRKSAVDLITHVKSVGSAKLVVENEHGEEVETDERIEVVVSNDELAERLGSKVWHLHKTTHTTSGLIKAEAEDILRRNSKVYDSFEIDVEDISSLYPHEKVEFGDYVGIKDNNFNPPIILEGQIIETSYNLLNPNDKTYTVGEAVKRRTETDDLKDLIQTNENKTESIERRLVDVIGGERVDNVEQEQGFFANNLILSSNITDGNNVENFYKHNYDTDLYVGFSVGSGTPGSTNSGIRVDINNSTMNQYTAHTLTLSVNSDDEVALAFNRAFFSLINIKIDGEYLTEQLVPSQYSSFSHLNLSSIAGQRREVEITYYHNSVRAGAQTPELYVYGTRSGQTVQVYNLMIFEGLNNYNEANLYHPLNITTGGRLLDTTEDGGLILSKDELVGRNFPSVDFSYTSNIFDEHNTAMTFHFDVEIGYSAVSGSGAVSTLGVTIQHNNSIQTGANSIVNGGLNIDGGEGFTHSIYNLASGPDFRIIRPDDLDREDGGVLRFRMAISTLINNTNPVNRATLAINRIGGSISSPEHIDYIKFTNIQKHLGYRPAMTEYVEITPGETDERIFDDSESLIGQLETRVNNKANKEHTHKIEDIESLQDIISNLTNRIIALEYEQNQHNDRLEILEDAQSED